MIKFVYVVYGAIIIYAEAYILFQSHDTIKKFLTFVRIGPDY